jgi:hypothetical protein
LKPPWSNGKIYAHGGPSSGLKESILFLEIVYFLFLGGSEAAIGGRARNALFCVAISSKRRVRTRGHNPLVLLYFAFMVAQCKKRTPINTPSYQVRSVDAIPDQPTFSLVTTFK